MDFSTQSRFDPFVSNGLALKTLRVLPLILSTFLFVNRIAQFYAITTFMPPYMPYAWNTTPGKSPQVSRHFNPAPVLRVWLTISNQRILPGVLAIVMLARISLLANVLVRPDDLADGHGRLMYGIGLFLSFAHLPLAPTMLKLENTMKSPQTAAEDFIPLLQRWFKINNIRIWVTDAPLWLVTISAVVESIQM